MTVKKQTLEVGVETAFEFDSFYCRSVTVKNMTAGAIQFCDGPFDAAKAAVIPPYCWQTIEVTMPYGQTPIFYVKAIVAGDVEISFGHGITGILDVYSLFDTVGLIPHVLTFSDDINTTLTASIVRLHGETLNLDTPVALSSGATVFSGDVIEFDVTAEEGYDPLLSINNEVVELDEGSAIIIIKGETIAEAVGEEEAP